jgi:hypothetical protein
MEPKTDDVVTLEKLVDAHGLTYVLAALALMAFEKAEHVRVNWSDSAHDAKAWERTGRAIERFAGHAAIQTCPLN